MCAPPFDVRDVKIESTVKEIKRQPSFSSWCKSLLPLCPCSVVNYVYWLNTTLTSCV